MCFALIKILLHKRILLCFHNINMRRNRSDCALNLCRVTLCSHNANIYINIYISRCGIWSWWCSTKEHILYALLVASPEHRTAKRRRSFNIYILDRAIRAIYCGGSRSCSRVDSGWDMASTYVTYKHFLCWGKTTTRGTGRVLVLCRGRVDCKNRFDCLYQQWQQRQRRKSKRRRRIYISLLVERESIDIYIYIYGERSGCAIKIVWARRLFYIICIPMVSKIHFSIFMVDLWSTRCINQ